jgi:regulator of replication initiation timing
MKMSRPRKAGITGGHSIPKWGASIRKSLDETVIEQQNEIESLKLAIKHYEDRTMQLFEENNHLKDVIADAVSIAKAQHENFLFEPWNSLKDAYDKITNSK